jgi:hypothetical protein
MAREYGIGRVPADVDPVEETLARLEAAEIQAAHLAPLDHGDRERLTCRRCGEEGYWGEYPFSTYGHLVRGGTGICDDCGA